MSWHEEAWRVLDKCAKCGGLVTLEQRMGGYGVKCVCGNSVVDPTAIGAVTEWNKLQRRSK